MESFVQLLTVLFIFVFVLVITYLTTRWIGNYQKARNSGTNIELLDAHRLNQGQYIQIVRIGDRYLALAVGKDSVTLLCELTEEELTITDAMEGTGDQLVPGNFKKLLEDAKGKILRDNRK